MPIVHKRNPWQAKTKHFSSECGSNQYRPGSSVGLEVLLALPPSTLVFTPCTQGMGEFRMDSGLRTATLKQADFMACHTGSPLPGDGN